MLAYTLLELSQEQIPAWQEAANEGRLVEDGIWRARKKHVEGILTSQTIAPVTQEFVRYALALKPGDEIDYGGWTDSFLNTLEPKVREFGLLERGEIAEKSEG